MDYTTLVTAGLAVIATLFGREFLGRLVLRSQEFSQKRESDVVSTLAALAKDGSAAQIELTKEALTALKDISSSFGLLAATMADHNSKAEERMTAVKESLSMAALGLTVLNSEMNTKMDVLTGYVEALIVKMEVHSD